MMALTTFLIREGIALGLQTGGYLSQVGAKLQER